MRRLSIVLVVAVLVPVLLSGCSGSKSVSDLGLDSLLGMVTGNASLSTFMSLIQAAGLGDLLGGSNPLTLLAPSNDAFAALGEEALSSLSDPGNKDQLTQLLKNHMLSGSLSAADFAGGGARENLLGTALDVVGGDGGGLSIDGANVLESAEGSNGFVHMIDKVIMP